MGMLKVISLANSKGIPVNIGYLNGDLMENWFSQIRGQRFGSNNHPTISQIGPAQNTNIIVGNVLLVKNKKTNAGCNVLKSLPSLPHNKKTEEKMLILCCIIITNSTKCI